MKYKKKLPYLKEQDHENKENVICNLTSDISQQA